MDYLDFEIRIAATATGGYALTATCGDDSAAGDFTLALDETLLENHLLRIQNSVLVRSAQVRLSLNEAERTIQTLGRTLFDALFIPAVRDLFRATRRRAAAEGKRGVRLKLDIQSPMLAALPWEYLYHPGDQDYIGLSLHSPIIRTFPVATATPITLPRPLKILGMIANPYDQLLLKGNEEKERLESALAPLGNQVHLKWVANGTLLALKEALDDGGWHIFHYIGHGGFDRTKDEGFLAFEDESGKTKPAYATQLYRLFQRGKGLQLAVLNSCKSGEHSRKDLISAPAIALVRCGLPAVLAMQFMIPDSVAKALTSHFYRALARGHTVDFALSDARQSLTFDDVDALEWGVPVLYMRSAPPPAPPPSTPAPSTRKRASSQVNAKLRQNLLTAAADQAWDKVINIGETLIARNYEIEEVSYLVAEAYFDRAAVFIDQFAEDMDAFDVNNIINRIKTSPSEIESHQTDISRAIELNPGDALYFSLRGMLKGFATLSQSSGDFTDAYADFEIATTLAPEETAMDFGSQGMLHYLALLINHPAGDIVQAIENYTNAIKREPPTAELHFIRGCCYNIALLHHHPIGDYNKALEDYNLAIQLDPDTKEYYFERGRAYLNAATAQHQAGSYPDAIHDFTRAIMMDPTNHRYVDARGITYREAVKQKISIGNLEKALNDNSRAIELKPDNGWYYYSRGLTHKMMGKRAEANRDFAKAKELGYTG